MSGELQPPLQPFPYQDRAKHLARAEFAAGRRRVCLLMPTGSGKTLTSASIAGDSVARGTRVLFVYDRDALRDQTVRTFWNMGLRDLRVIQADRNDGSRDAPVVIASAQTLRTPRWLAALPNADLIIWDECHHLLSDTFSGLVRRYPKAWLLGLTATPIRGDGKPLGDAFESLVIGATMREMIELERLARPRVYAPAAELDANQIALDPVAAYRERAEGQRAALFCLTISQAERYVVDFREAGITAELITAKTRDRAGILRRFAAGEFTILASVGTLTEGWDDPGCSVAILARKPAHVGLWLQICGRVLRAHPGKTHGTIIDLCGAVHDHGLPDAEREYSLEGEAIRLVEDRDAIRQCQTCGAVFRAGTSCPACGAEVQGPPARPPRSTDVGVVEVTSETIAQPRKPFTKTVLAKRAGYCARCGRWFPPATPIYWTANAADPTRNVRHVRCEAPPLSSATEARR